ncbi:Mtpn [Symbiodinium natans]|uniref:Mtpn protein n=1 Tax=Symbiodinium natans TaxID=878477 RepID=A0A812L930_9DINO|nr:Mtpn [Symbiodinium natans]
MDLMTDAQAQTEGIGTLSQVVAAAQATPLPSSGEYWLLGVCLAVAGTLVGTIGKQMIRRAEMYKQDKQDRESAILFYVGLMLQVALNPLCDMAGYALAPATVIAPVTGMDIVWNTVIAPCSLGEKLTSRRLLSTCIIFFAATASVLFRPIKQVEWTTEYVETVLLQNRTLLYGLCFLAWYLWNVTIQTRYERGSPIRGFSLGATAGSLAGNMWCTKITATLAGQCVNGNCDAWDDWVSWACLSGAIFFSTSNLYYISRGMQQHEALFMVTVYMGSNIATNSLSAIVVLSEMDNAPWWKFAGYIACILFMMVGMVLLTSGEKDSEARELECSPCVELAEAQHLAIVLSILREAKPKKSQLSMALHLVSTCGQGRWREGLDAGPQHERAIETYAKVFAAMAYFHPFSMSHLSGKAPHGNACITGTTVTIEARRKLQRTPAYSNAIFCLSQQISLSSSRCQKWLVLAVERSVAEGASVNAVDVHGWSALHYSAQSGQLEVCKFLLQQGSDINGTLNDFSTPLMLAVEEGHLNVAQLLLSNGAVPWCKDETGFTAKDRCDKSIQAELLQLLATPQGYRKVDADAVRV